MKKLICIVLCAVMLLALCACGGKKEQPAQATPAAQEPEVKDWTRAGFFLSGDDDLLNIMASDDEEHPGWYVGCILGEDMYGWYIQQEGNALHGNIVPEYEEGEFIVTVTEEGEDGVLLAVEGGASYHFLPYDVPEATIFVTINTEGWGGNIDYAEGTEAPEIDTAYPYQSAQINLAEPATHTFVAWPDAGYVFVKWTKDGEDFSTEPVVTVLLDESADYVAVFEEDPDWQNPVMNFIGEYQSGRAHALVECWDKQDAWITIEWGSSAWELARWNIVGTLDLNTLTIPYEWASKVIVVYNEDGEVESEEAEYEDGTGTITFNNDGTFTWHEDQSEYGTDMVFEWIPADQEAERFDTTIILEGMEETVHYERVVNRTAGFEMYYDYENFTRNSYPNLECFISVWDGLGNPENFLEVSHREEDADTVAAAVKEELSQEYDLLESTRELDRAGECIYIEASVLRGTNNMADQLQAVYIIPGPEGCFVAAAHYAAEAAEGFGHRFHYMLQTFSAI